MAFIRIMHLVPPNYVLGLENIVEPVPLSYASLTREFNGPIIKLIQWCAIRRLLRNSHNCLKCNIPSYLMQDASKGDTIFWRCPNCNKKSSIRVGSVFSYSRIPIIKVLYMIYGWAYDYPPDVIGREAEVADPSAISAYCHLLRELCVNYLNNNPIQIGGIGAEGGPNEVEVLVRDYYQGKYHPGQTLRERWVFSGIERGTGKCFLVSITDKAEATLSNVILQRILPGTIIISDAETAYCHINQLGGGIYQHEVAHSFIDPDKPQVHTNNVKNLWMRAKKKLQRQYGTSEEHFLSYLNEFIWRNSVKGEDVFKAILTCCTTANINT